MFYMAEIKKNKQESDSSLIRGELFAAECLFHFLISIFIHFISFMQSIYVNATLEKNLSLNQCTVGRDESE